ncbi:acidic fibroblast growth factor binding protein [Gaertneriomyces semiglobifer]|nr:acidic fibroblast growth factor binding protein [Gaertneriomyces semiglobifer]
MDYAVFVSNHLVVDKTLWKVYLMGLTVDQAVSYVSKKREVASTSSMELAALRHFVTTQYRNYELLEHPLHHPPILHTHPHFPLPKPTINTLIQSYYALMPAVLRCILGKKLSTKTRKELEDYGERVGLMRSGCRRMFENLRRIARDVDEKMDPVESVIKGYLLDRDLACQYVNTIFLSSYRFDTTKRKLSHLEPTATTGCAGYTQHALFTEEYYGFI